jgi:YtkA-like
MHPLPTDVGPGDTWNTELTILQHGETPLTGLSPTISISLDDTGRTETFTATETDEPGVYAASVVFPEAGPWRVVAHSSFGESQLTYGPVEIEPTPGAGGGSGTDVPVLPAVVVLAGIALAAAALFGVRRQRRLHPAG